MLGNVPKYLMIILPILCISLMYGLFLPYYYPENYRRHLGTRRKSYESREVSLENLHPTSILGEWLRAPEATPPPKEIRRNRNDSSYLLILVWKYGRYLERRHIYRFGANNSSGSRLSPWQGCSVRSCRLSYRDDDLSRADAVLFHLHLTKSVREIPSKRGKPGQIWIFMTDESPLHTFLYEQTGYEKNKISDYDDLFDWSMTYRSDSDVPVAYGRTIMRSGGGGGGGGKNSRRERTKGGRTEYKLVAILGSNCSSKNSRWKYARELKRVLGDKLDVYGRCLGGNTTACPGHFDRDCPLLDSYKFYLAFENSNCREYLTEKIYWNAYEKRSVPIVMGAPREDCQRLLPPRSFIHVDDFFGPTELANYLDYLDANDAAYAKYHDWRSRYIILNEHGYFGSASRHYCRVCQALRYNRPPPSQPARNSRYRFLENFWNSSKDCGRRDDDDADDDPYARHTYRR